MAAGLIASLAIPFLTDMVSKHGEKLVGAGIKKVTGIDIKKEELSPANIEKIKAAEVQLRNLDMEELRLEYENTANARAMNVEIQTSSEASELAKNAAYFLDFAAVGATILVGLMLFFFQIPAENKELAYTLFGALLAQSTTVFNFHRGSSKGSAEKSAQLSKFMKG